MDTLMISRRIKAGLLLTLLVLVCVTLGFLLGLGVAKAIAKKKDDPAFWNEAALRHLEKLHPDETQRERFKVLVGGAVDELTVVRQETISDVQRILTRLLSDIDKELSPEQHEMFSKMKPKPSDLSLDVLQKTGPPIQQPPDRPSH